MDNLQNGQWAIYKMDNWQFEKLTTVNSACFMAKVQFEYQSLVYMYNRG